MGISLDIAENLQNVEKGIQSVSNKCSVGHLFFYISLRQRAVVIAQLNINKYCK